MTSISRRQFLIGAGTLTAAATIIGWHFMNQDSPLPPDEAIQKLLSRDGFQNGEVIDFGKEYAAQNKDEADSQTLFKLLSEGMGNASAPIRVHDLEFHLHRKIKDDYTNGRTVSIKHWYLSRTEGRVCALVAGYYA